MDDATRPSPIQRRHSVDHLPSQSHYTDSKRDCNRESKAYDEDSFRAKELQSLLRDRHGLEDPTWSPEIAMFVSRT